MSHELFKISDDYNLYGLVWIDKSQKNDHEAALLLDEIYNRAAIRAGSISCENQIRIDLVFDEASELADVPA